jgi:hypothetical protein
VKSSITGDENDYIIDYKWKQQRIACSPTSSSKRIAPSASMP